jgi:hypothetical protein
MASMLMIKIGKEIKRSLRNILSEAGYSIRRTDDLTAMADRFGSDKGNVAWAHGYARIYDKLFRDRRDKELAFVEIGLLRAEVDKRRERNGAEGATSAVAHDAPSLRMWRRYFRSAQIVGFDIDDFSGVRIPGCRIMRGDMSSPEDLARLVDFIGRSIDILVEDGSHASHHQQIALGALFPSISPGGMYIIEDLHWQDAFIEKAQACKTRDVLRRFLVTGTIQSPYMSDTQREYLERNVERVFLFDSLTMSVEDPTDALAVLVKK